MTSKTYDLLKIITQLILPALGTLYFALAGIWGLPAAEEIIGTIVAVDTFLGVVLQLSSKAYAKSEARFNGTIDVTEKDEEHKMFTLNLPCVPEDLERLDEVTFKINK